MESKNDLFKAKANYLNQFIVSIKHKNNTYGSKVILNKDGSLKEIVKRDLQSESISLGEFKRRY